MTIGLGEFLWPLYSWWCNSDHRAPRAPKFIQWCVNDWLGYTNPFYKMLSTILIYPPRPAEYRKGINSVRVSLFVPSPHHTYQQCACTSGSANQLEKLCHSPQRFFPELNLFVDCQATRRPTDWRQFFDIWIREAWTEKEFDSWGFFSRFPSWGEGSISLDEWRVLGQLWSEFVGYPNTKLKSTRHFCMLWVVNV